MAGKNYTRVDLNELESRLEESIMKKLSCKYEAIETENKKLSRENSNLKEINFALMKKIDKLLAAIGDDGSVPPPPPCLNEGESLNYVHPDLETSATLILSDSIFRHIGSSCPKVAGSKGPVIDDFTLDDTNNMHAVHKVVVPGARAGRLWEEAVRVQKEGHRFSDVIVCAGANYSRTHTTHSTVEELQEFLLAVSDLFPDARVGWSLILPQFDCTPPVFDAVMAGIRRVNEEMVDFCIVNNIGILFTPEYSLYQNDYNTVRKLFAYDGLHLNKAGIDIMSAAVNEYIFALYKY